jgi:hypothetical protein
VTVAAEIIQDIVSALRSGVGLALVTLGPAPSATAVPRAAVIYEGEDSFPADDSPDCRHARLACRVIIHARCDQPAQQATRAMELCTAAREAILADLYRGGRCRDLPIGRATEVGRAKHVGGVKGPEVEAVLAVCCHFQVGEDD